MNLIDQHIKAISELCQLYRVDYLYVFGSVLTDKFHVESDIDFVVKFGEVELYDYFDNYMDFKESLEKLLQRPVDLLEAQAIKNPILLQSIDRNKKLIYGRPDKKVAA